MRSPRGAGMTVLTYLCPTASRGPRRRLQGRYRLGHWPVVLLRSETAQCTVRPTKGQVRSTAPSSSVAVRDRGH